MTILSGVIGLGGPMCKRVAGVMVCPV